MINILLLLIMDQLFAELVFHLIKFLDILFQVQFLKRNVKFNFTRFERLNVRGLHN